MAMMENKTTRSMLEIVWGVFLAVPRPIFATEASMPSWLLEELPERASEFLIPRIGDVRAYLT